MNIYLPIAELSLDMTMLLALGGGVGLLSGMFGIGGGFVLTPLLMFLGVPPAIAVATGANQAMGASVSGMVAHWRRRNVDFRMGGILLAGGVAGSCAGIALFVWLHRLGHVDTLISLSYVVFLGLVGTLMAIESVAALRRRHLPLARPRKRHRHPYPSLPFKMRFPRSGLYISVLVPLAIGALGGLLSALMGVGGGFIIVPLMIYVIEIPTAVVVGTSLFQMIFIAATVTLLHAATTQSVDAVLMLVLLVGGAVGAQIGVRFGGRLRSEQLRLLLALLVLLVCARLAVDLILPPRDPFVL